MALTFCCENVYFDKPLLRLSTENIPASYPAPDIEMCVQASPMTIVRCDLMYVNWSTSTIPNCYDKIRLGTHEPWDTQWCNLFEANGSINYGVESKYPANTDLIKRIDIYWRIDSIENATKASLSVPAIALQLYSPSFSRWKLNPKDMIDQQARPFRDMELGTYRSTSYQNATSNIFFTPTKYRAIRPKDAGSILGFETNYVDVVTIESAQQTWPLHPNENLTRGDYHGMFSVQLSKGTMEVKTEQRLHTVLQAVAMAGGAYGILTTLYILLFGMSRLTPWGLVHQLPVLIGSANRRMRTQENNRCIQNGLSDEPVKSAKAKVPWFSRKSASTENQNVELKDTSKEVEDTKYRKEMEDDQRSDQYLLSNQSPILPTLAGSNVPNYPNEQLMQEHLTLQQHSKELESRVEELEIILREYFLNTDYLDQLRSRRQIQPEFVTVARERQSITRPRRGFGYDREDPSVDRPDVNELVEVVATTAPTASSSATALDNSHAIKKVDK
ncbi:hypothetical protein EC973_001915 [Apophysomyces ossiformis]|uniref:Uncharacterized protein n=1 Tax=Apophysomyces ossiformis TaxID=679940 RepID=A0A8H7ET83_9FUNG|nr:hypothetical protein EC973_001915 [Apophysomyces ossiformis]